jgi:hypothetical protein
LIQRRQPSRALTARPRGLMELIKTLKATRSQLFSLTAQKIPHGHGCGLPCLRYANFEFSCATHCRMKPSATG